ncbi:Cytochrome P450 [Macleaya cordata]|uniref:Cytochrome P450 n=1 Tax=Macleaya cordata TaxID=56857 RepID=A0A200PN42_MACCD|nr:Cytochrome P450 [Macleaya cordata]
MLYFQSIISLYSFDEYYFKKWPEQLYLLLVLFFCLFLSIRLYLKTKNHPVLVHWPIVGILPSLIQNAHRIYDWTVDISNTFGGTIAGRGPVFAGLDILHTCDPRNVKYILSTNSSNFPKGLGFKETFDIFGEGLFNSDSHFWLAQRRIARMTFNSKKVRNIITNMSQKVVQDALLPLLSHVAKQSSVVDLEDVLLRYTFDTSVNIIFGRNPNYLSTSFPWNKLANAIDEAMEAVFYRHIVPSSWWKFCRWFMIGSNERKLEKAWRTIDQHLTPYITATREDMATKGISTEESDLLQVYMGLKEGEKDELLLSKMSCDKFFRDTGFSFLMGARDTTASALVWFFWLLSKNPCVEAKILEELKLVFLKNTKGENCSSHLKTKRLPCTVFDADDQTGLVYLHAALCECLRLYPPAPLNRRNAVKDDVLPDGTVVKSGMLIIISSYAMGRMEWVWGKDCLEFKPERWMDEDGKLNHEAMSKLISFSQGPRICVGKDMGFVMMKAAASAMLFNFHVEVLEGQNIQPKPSITIGMKNGLMVRIKERELIL